MFEVPMYVTILEHGKKWVFDMHTLYLHTNTCAIGTYMHMHTHTQNMYMTNIIIEI